MHTIIIAEAGVNHNGDMSLAKKLIDEAKEAGADFVKFQTAVDCTSRYAPKAEYQKRETGAEESQLQMALKLRLKLDQHYELYEYCKAKGIQSACMDRICTCAIVVWLGLLVKLLTVGTELALTLLPAFGTPFLILSCLFQPRRDA